MGLTERLVRFVGWSDVRSAGPSGLWRPLLAELVGTELLMLLAVGAGLWAPAIPPVGDGAAAAGARMLIVALAAGLTVAVVIECVAHVSGGHINPAVTAGVVAAGEMSLLRGLLYVLAQLLGSLAGSLLLFLLTPRARLPAGVTALGPGVSLLQGVTIESLITFVLVMVAFATLDRNRTDVKTSPPYFIGLSVVIGHLYAMTVTGASMNPARSFGMSVVTGKWDHHWVYWLGPISGGMSAAVMYKLAFAAPPREEAAQNNKATNAESRC